MKNYFNPLMSVKSKPQTQQGKVVWSVWFLSEIAIFIAWFYMVIYGAIQELGNAAPNYANFFGGVLGLFILFPLIFAFANFVFYTVCRVWEK